MHSTMGISSPYGQNHRLGMISKSPDPHMSFNANLPAGSNLITEKSANWKEIDPFANALTVKSENTLGAENQNKMNNGFTQ